MVNLKSKVRKQKTKPTTGKNAGASLNQSGLNTSSWYHKPRIILGIVLLITVLVYSRGLTGHFLYSWDDGVYVTANPDIQSWNSNNIKAWFTKDYSKNYQPLTVITYAVEYAIAGQQSSFLYHLDNLILHLINIILIFWLFSLFSGKPWLGVLMAAFHALHPIHVESVTWISERKDVLYTCFFLLSMIMYYFYLFRGLDIKNTNREPHPKKKRLIIRYFCLALLFFLLSLVSKPAALLLPVVLLLMDFLFKRKFSINLLLEKIPFFAIAIVFGLLMMRTQSEGIRSMTFYTTFQKLLLINGSVWRYLYMTVFPIPLSTFHPYPVYIPGKALSDIYYVAPLFTALIAIFAIRSLRKTRVVVFGLCFFLTNLLLILQFVPIGYSIIAERYTYMPFLGIFFIFTDAVVRLTEDPNPAKKYLKSASFFLIILLLTIFSITTFSRNKVWQNDISLWTDAIENYPNTAFFPYYRRGLEYIKKDETKAKAYDDFDHAIRIKPNYHEALYSRGTIKADSGNNKGALEDYSLSIQYSGKNYLVYNARGDARRQLNDLSGALEDFNKALAMNPGDTLIIMNRGMVYAAMGKMEAAIIDYDKAIQTGSKFYFAYNNRGAAKEIMKDYEGALEDYNKAVELFPKYTAALFNRGNLKTKRQDFQGAISDLQNVLKIDPRYYNAYFKLGNLLMFTGNKNGACQAWKSGADLGIKVCSDFYNNYCR